MSAHSITLSPIGEMKVTVAVTGVVLIRGSGRDSLVTDIEELFSILAAASKAHKALVAEFRTERQQPELALRTPEQLLDLQKTIFPSTTFPLS